MASMLYIQIFWFGSLSIRFIEPWTTERVLDHWKWLP